MPGSQGPRQSGSVTVPTDVDVETCFISGNITCMEVLAASVVDIGVPEIPIALAFISQSTPSPINFCKF